MPAPDRIITLGRSRVQHGPHSDRVYLMRLAPEDMPGLLARLDALARDRGYGKIFARVPTRFLPAFRRRGYREEARIPGFYQGRTACSFLGRYFDPARAREPDPARCREVLKTARAATRAGPPGLPDRFTASPARPADADALARLYRAVFETSPFPVQDPAYIRATMRHKVRYICVRHRDKIVAAAAADRSDRESAAEMTDFAARPEARGHGLARFLLARLEQEMAGQGIRTAYTIARARSVPMNRTFAALGYRHAGLLINNTQISGGLESMNVWYKPLARAPGA